ncbi:hypothetical protein BaRGS_00012493, partial [Batillaria attramentaria]
AGTVASYLGTDKRDAIDKTPDANRNYSSIQVLRVLLRKQRRVGRCVKAPGLCAKTRQRSCLKKLHYRQRNRPFCVKDGDAGGFRVVKKIKGVVLSREYVSCLDSRKGELDAFLEHFHYCSLHPDMNLPKG